MIRQKAVVVIVIIMVASLGANVASGQNRQDDFAYEVDPTIQPTQRIISGKPGELPRTIVVMMNPNGIIEEFAENEVILKPTSDEELTEFLIRYGGRILNDGTVPPPPPMIGYDRLREPFLPSNYYLIQIDPNAIDLASFPDNMQQLEFQGVFRFSSISAAKLIALIAQEKLADRLVYINNLVLPQSPQCVVSSTQEHPTDPSAPNVTLPNEGFYDAFDWQWLNDPDLQVTKAWQYMDVLGKSHAMVHLAVVDIGFHVNQDFRGFPQIWGYDFIEGDYHEGVMSDDFDYHGTCTFSVAGALLDNRFGSAGTGGQVVVPLFFRAFTEYHIACAIFHAAVNWGAEVVTVSMATCDSFSTTEYAVNQANSKGVIIVAAAGNDEKDLATTNPSFYRPITAPWVIGVGAIDLASKQAVRKTMTNGVWGSNFGSYVDIWAPGNGIVSTNTPSSGDGLTGIGATSAATPYVAGIVALMKAIDPSLDHDKALSILQSTANQSSDARVSPGYINAFEAVKETAHLAGLYPIGDSFEYYDSFHTAHPITKDKDYVATIIPADNDYFSFSFDDYLEFKLSLLFNSAGGNNELDLDVYDSSLNLLKTVKNWSSTGAGVNSFTKTIGGSADREYYVRVHGSASNSINCYTLRLSGGKTVTIQPDAYDDEKYPDGTPGEPRNDNSANRAVIPGIVKASSPLYGLGMGEISDLNFHVINDIDFFEVQLASETSPTGHSECLDPGTKPYGESGFSQGHLKIEIIPAPEGIAEPFDLRLYNSNGNEYPDNMYNKWGLGLEIECPHNHFSDGVICFSVKTKSGRRNFYDVSLRYARWNIFLDIPVWDELMAYPPLFRCPQPPWVDLITRLYPSNPSVIDGVFSDPLPYPLPPEYAVLPWEETRDLDLYLFTDPGHYLEMTLYDAEQQVIATTASATASAGHAGAGTTREEHLHVADLSQGTYLLAFGPGDFATVYSVRIGAHPLYTEALVGVDVGGPLPKGTIDRGVSAGDRIITSGGADIWGTADQFFYAVILDPNIEGSLLCVNGDFTVIIGIRSMEPYDTAHEWAKAGIMVRESFESGSPHIMTIRSLRNGICLQGRDIPDEESWSMSMGGDYGPDDTVWLRLGRKGKTFTGSYAIGSETPPMAWTASSSHDVTMSPELLVGLATTSHQQGVPISVEYSDFRVWSYTGPVILTEPELPPDSPAGADGYMGIREVIDNGEIQDQSACYASLNSSMGNIVDHWKPVLNIQDSGENGNYDNDDVFGIVDMGYRERGGIDYLSMIVKGTIHIPEGESGTYTLGVNSDDGFTLQFPGQNFISVVNGEIVEFETGTALRFYGVRATADTLGVIDLPAGDHPFWLTFHESVGGAVVEFFAARGVHSAFDPVVFRLVGDVDGLQLVGQER